MIFLVNLDDFFTVVCTDFHEVVVYTRYVPFLNCMILSWIMSLDLKHGYSEMMEGVYDLAC